MDPTYQVTAIIPTLNNQVGLELILAELITAGIPVVVVNNGNQLPLQFGGQAVTSDQFKNIKILKPEKNMGFAGAVNFGAQTAKTEWLLILNDDVEGITSQLVNPSASSGLSQLISQAVKKQWVATSPIVVDPEGNIENIGYRVLSIGKVELNFETKKNSSADLDGLTAACLLIKREVFEKMSGFDARFFAYLEDVDLFLNLKKEGYHFGVATEIKVTHRHLTTSMQMKKGFKQRQDLINWWRIVIKHPKKFIFQPQIIGMLLERGRNVSGYLKAH
jgi:O-antigen biosynthesis protein